jgi:hypothetical protein
MVGTTGAERIGADELPERPTICPYASGGPQAARSTIYGSLSDGTSAGTNINSDDMSDFYDSQMSVRPVTYSNDKVCFI